ncbi:MAG: hypothetical protein ABF449_02390 [Ethanoligenens sp.]
MLNYRIAKNLMSDWGHAMFCNRVDAQWCQYDEHIKNGDPVYVLDSKDCTDIHDLHSAIVEAWESEENKPEYLIDTDSEEIFASFDPEDIIDSANAWDNGDMVAWFWEKIAEPKDIMAVQLTDGAIAFDQNVIRLATQEDL